MTPESLTITETWITSRNHNENYVPSLTYGVEYLSISKPRGKRNLLEDTKDFLYTKLNVSQILHTKYCITIEAGKSLYECLIVKLRHGQRVVLDFAGVEDITAPFLNTAIGDLLEHYSLKQLQDTLKTENLSELDREMLEDILVEFDRYYRDPGFRQAVDKPFEGFNEAEAWL